MTLMASNFFTPPNGNGVFDMGPNGRSVQYDMHGYYQPQRPYKAFYSTVGGFPQDLRFTPPQAGYSTVGQQPPASSESEQAQVAGQFQERMVVIGVLAVLAGAAVIYTTRKGAR